MPVSKPSSYRSTAALCIARLCVALLGAVPLAGFAATYVYTTATPYAWETAATNVVWDRADTDYVVDDDKQLVNIGFTFNFGGVNYTQVRVLSNGALHFGADQGFQKDFTSEALPITGFTAGPGFEEAADRVILPYWDDMNPSSGGTVRYSTLGGAPNRRFVASWEGVPRYPGTGSYTFQAILYENGDIKFQYQAGNATGTSAAIGVEVNDTDYTQYSYNTNTVAAGSTILFYKPRPHFAIGHDGAGNTCAPENITLSRHTSTHTVDTAYTGAVTLSTSTAHGTWSRVSGNGTLVDHGNGNATYTFVAADRGQVVLGLSDTTAETLNINVQAGAGTEGPGEDPSLDYSAPTTGDTFRDNFSTRAFGNNDGTVNWSAAWVEVDGDAAGPTVGNVQVNAVGEMELDNRPSTAAGSSLTREANLAPYTFATLTFNYRAADQLDAADSFVVEVSANGGAAWTTLENFIGIVGSVTGSRSYNITSYRSANTRIRFRVNSGYTGNGELFYVDNVQITADTVVACAGLDHFVVVHDNAGINCLPETVSVTAVDLAGNPVTNYTGTITMNTQSTAGTWSLMTGGGGFVDTTADDGLATYQFVSADNGTARFLLAYTHGAATLDIDAYAGATRDNDTEGALVFTPSGFIVTPSVLSNPPPASINQTILAQTSATSFTLYLTAYGQTPTDAQCGVIEAYTGAKNIKFWADHNNPATATRSVTVNGNAIANSQAVASAQGVTFNQGQASVTVNYDDVGNIGLGLKDGTVVNPDLPSGISGSSQPFVVKPAGFVLSNILRSSDSASNPAASTAGGPLFARAGESFSVTVTAVNALGNVTQYFGQETPAESVRLTPTLVAAGAGNNPAIAYATGFGDFSLGVASGTDFSWGEVGIITLTPAVADASYLGAGDVTGTTTGNIGRFFPYDFNVTLAGAPNFFPGCGSFTYLAQNIVFNTAPVVTITARNRAGAATQNYTNAWWRLVDVTPTYAHSGAISSGASLSASLATHTAPACSNCNGSTTTTFGGALRYTGAVPETDPYNGAVTISFPVTSDEDGDGVNDVSYAGNPFVIGPIGFAGGLAEVRAGRAYAQDVYGTVAQLNDVLTLPVGAHYYNSAGGGWLANAADACSSVAYTHSDVDMTAAVTPASPVSFSAGRADLRIRLAADGGVPGGTSSLSFTWPAWLSGPANANATFGIFRGDDRFLHWREAP